VALWAIPSDKIIDYSKNGDDINAFAQKVKYCLEEAFNSLAELHGKQETIAQTLNNLAASGSSSGGGGSGGGTSTVIVASDATKLAGVPLVLNNLSDGQILVYHSSSGTFRNEAKGTVGAGQSLIIKNGDEVVGDYNGGTTLEVNLQAVINQTCSKQDIAHLIRLVENLYLTLKVAGLDPGGYDGLKSFTFYGDVNDLASSSAQIADGKIICTGAGQIVVTKPIYFDVPISRAYLSVKHQNFADIDIGAEISVQGGNFATMTKLGTYPDSDNPNRATTQFVCSVDSCTSAALALVLSCGGSGSFTVDSFACTFNE